MINNRHSRVLLLSLLVLTCQPSATLYPAAVHEGNGFAIRNVRVFDGQQTLPNATVIIEGGIIASVSADTRLPADLPTIDGTGKTLLPGFIDAHTHSWADAQRDALRFGVTGELDMLGDSHRLSAIKRNRESLARTTEADLWSAGAAMTAPGGHGTQYGLKVPTLAPDDDAAEFVAARLQEGSDYIKIIIEDMSAHGAATRWPTIGLPQIANAVSAAHRANKMAVVHVSKQQDARGAVEAQADGLVHIFLDNVADDQFVQAAKEHGTFVVATLSVIASEAQSGDGRNLLSDDRLKAFLTAAQRETLAARFPSAAHPEYLKNAMQSVRKLHLAGIPILAGTDAGNPGTAHGASLHGELDLLVRSGLTPMEALTAATSLPAKHFKLADRGRIAPGFRADLVLVDGDPTTDITATRAIVGVWKNGYAVDRVLASAEPGAHAPAIADSSLISDFDSGSIASTFGAGWQPTTDQMMGGASTVSHRIVSEGAKGTAGALELSGEIKDGFGFPWAGMMFFPADQPMQPIDLSSKTDLIFHARGDGKTYNVLVFSGESMQGVPIVQTFTAGETWQEIRIPLAKFAGANFALLRGLTFSAGQPIGAFQFQIDQVELR